MTTPVSFAGLASGIDTSALISSILNQERALSVTPLKNRIAEHEETTTAFGRLKELLGKLKGALSSFREVNGGAVAKSATSSDDTVVFGTASNGASPGRYDVTVSQLAKNATFSFNDSFSGPDQVINGSVVGSGTVTVTIGNGGSPTTVQVGVTSSTTVSQFISDFNSKSSAGTASLVKVGADYRLVINSNKTGENEGFLAVSASSEITSAGSFTGSSLSQATNARLSIDGVSDIFVRQSNVISDLIPGLTFNLSSLGSATVAVTQDTGKTLAAVQDFVAAFNKVRAFIDESDRVSSSEEQGTVKITYGPLAKTSLDESIGSALRGALSSASLSGGSVNTLADLGITTARDGSLQFDSDVLSASLDADPQRVGTILESLGETLAATGGTIDQFTRFNGIIDNAVSQNQVSISQAQQRISDYERRISQHEAALTAQYAHLEAVISQLNGQQSALSSLSNGGK